MERNCKMREKERVDAIQKRMRKNRNFITKLDESPIVRSTKTKRLFDSVGISMQIKQQN